MSYSDDDEHKEAKQVAEQETEVEQKTEVEQEAQQSGSDFSDLDSELKQPGPDIPDVDFNELVSLEEEMKERDAAADPLDNEADVLLTHPDYDDYDDEYKDEYKETEEHQQRFGNVEHTTTAQLHLLGIASLEPQEQEFKQEQEAGIDHQQALAGVGAGTGSPAQSVVETGQEPVEQNNELDEEKQQEEYKSPHSPSST